MLIRTDKFLTDLGIGSRSDVKNMIRKKRVRIDGEICIKPETKLDPSSSQVMLDGEVLPFSIREYLLMNKPAGVISSTRDGHEPTVIDLLDGIHRKDLFPVGRLDKDSVGLLLLTNDGQLAHRLLSPARHVDKSYYVQLRNPLKDADILSFSEGIDIGDDKPTLPARLIPDPLLPEAATVILHEGRFHQIKRMFEALDNEVLYLKRTAFGPLLLDPSLPEGCYRPLFQHEIDSLKAYRGQK